MPTSREIAAALTKMVNTGYDLIEVIKSTSMPVPYERFQQALKEFDEMVGLRLTDPELQQKPKRDPVLKVLREDLKVGATYVLHRPCDTKRDSVEFEYDGEADPGRTESRLTSSFWAKIPDGSREKWYYADCGLEAYARSGSEPWWHKENWVSLPEIDQKLVNKAMDKVLDALLQADPGVVEPPEE